MPYYYFIRSKQLITQLWGILLSSQIKLQINLK